MELNSSGIPKKKINQFFLKQIDILKALRGTLLKNKKNIKYQAMTIEEISEITAINNEIEVQRMLYILEGQRLVSPYPDYDLTSKMWLVTKKGLEFLLLAEKYL